MKISGNLIALIVGSCIVIAGLVFLNNINISLRLKEMRLYFQQLDVKESNVDHIRLIMKYKLSKQLYDGTILQSEADETEHHINVLTNKMLP